jgi:hypothetical protein
MYDVAVNVVKYLVSTNDYGLKYDKSSDIVIKAQVHSDWASSYDRKSTGGFVIFLNKQVIAFKSKKQGIVAVSSAEAEYIAVTEVIKSLRSSLTMVEELKLQVVLPIKNRIDNQAAIVMLESSKVHC